VEPEEILRRRLEIIERDGPWTAHNVHLGHGLYTISPDVNDDWKLRRVTQIVRDVTGGKLTGLRVLDLACLEGEYAIELALQGARAVGIEGRAVSVAKARFAAEALGVDGVEFFEDDVRNLSQEKYGLFDVVLCLGILYHLDSPDVFRFLESIASVCTGVVVFDTHVGLTDRVEHVWNDKSYRGFAFVEHEQGAAPAKKLEFLWASLDNPTSFWPTRSSLFNMLLHAGFTSVYECQVPAEADKPSDRLTLLAFKGTPVALRSLPNSKDRAAAEWRENPRPQPHPDQRPFAHLRRSVPEPLRRLVRRVRQVLLPS
jgi:SAM-dependent methyltransferase